MLKVYNVHLHYEKENYVDRNINLSTLGKLDI